MDKFIPVAAPIFIGNEKKYVQDCLETTWISSSGKYVDQFESAFAEFCGVKYALSCCNGTVALHLALMALGVGPGDEVIVPTLTFIATANAVTYCGAKPIFVDSESETWNLNPAQIENLITARTKGIIVVHLYGHPVDMDPILAIAKKFGLFIIEDAAEAHGAEYKGRKVGSMGDIGTFSFFGNKIITTGEGGMVITNDDKLAKRVRQLKGQGQDFERRYWFTMVGYNYRMTNIAAAIGLAQLEKIDWHIQRRIEVAELYRKQLSNIPNIKLQSEKEWAKHVYWMFNVVLDKSLFLERDKVMVDLRERGIETRPIFYPIHTLPPYRDSCRGCNFPVADWISQRGISLPTWAGVNREDITYICDSLAECFKVKCT